MIYSRFTIKSFNKSNSKKCRSARFGSLADLISSVFFIDVRDVSYSVVIQQRVVLPVSGVGWSCDVEPRDAELA